VIVVSDPLVAAHLAEALSQHVKRLRGNGSRVPDEVLQVLACATQDARGRQGTTRLDALDSAPDSARMAPVLLLSYDEAAVALGRSKRSVQRLVAQGHLAAVGSPPRIRRADLEAFVDELGGAS
jgi:excisionase family DNA binding protein